MDENLSSYPTKITCTVKSCNGNKDDGCTRDEVFITYSSYPFDINCSSYDSSPTTKTEVEE